MYGANHEKKLTQADMKMTCDNIRKELEQEIDIEHRRINVDSAKKKAVLFRYDYEGFRQMVLGANLYNLKSKELGDFGLTIKPSEKVLNPQLNSFIPTEEELLYFQQQVKAIECNSFRDFRSLFQKAYVNPLTEDAFSLCMNILRAQQPKNLRQIFAIDFQVGYFFQILDVFTFLLAHSRNGNDICFIVGFLDELTKIKDFATQIRTFLKKTEKQQLKEFMDQLQQLLAGGLQDVQTTEQFSLTMHNLMIFYG